MPRTCSQPSVVRTHARRSRFNCRLERGSTCFLARGAFRWWYRGGLVAGYVVPLALLAVRAPAADVVAALSAAVGVFLWAWALVMAPQAVPNS